MRSEHIPDLIDDVVGASGDYTQWGKRLGRRVEVALARLLDAAEAVKGVEHEAEKNGGTITLTVGCGLFQLAKRAVDVSPTDR